MSPTFSIDLEAKDQLIFQRDKEITMTRPLKRRDFLKGLGLGVGAVYLGDPLWTYAQTGKDITSKAD